MISSCARVILTAFLLYFPQMERMSHSWMSWLESPPSPVSGVANHMAWGQQDQFKPTHVLARCEPINKKVKRPLVETRAVLRQNHCIIRVETIRSEKHVYFDLHCIVHISVISEIFRQRNGVSFSQLRSKMKSSRTTYLSTLCLVLVSITLLQYPYHSLLLSPSASSTPCSWIFRIYSNLKGVSLFLLNLTTSRAPPSVYHGFQLKEWGSATCLLPAAWKLDYTAPHDYHTMSCRQHPWNSPLELRKFRTSAEHRPYKWKFGVAALSTVSPRFSDRITITVSRYIRIVSCSTINRQSVRYELWC